MNKAQMIKALNETFPGVMATDGTEFYGRHSDCIWFKGSETADIDGLPMFDNYCFEDTFGTNPALEAFLQARGWFSEPYDSGTLMAAPE